MDLPATERILAVARFLIYWTTEKVKLNRLESPTKAVHLVGTFRGFRYQQVYELVDGTCWLQRCVSSSEAHIESPVVHLHRSQRGFYLQIEGSGALAYVLPVQWHCTSKIVGDFDGWDRNVNYTLSNGQSWQQADTRFNYTYAYRPIARLYSHNEIMFMCVSGTTARVRRLSQST